MANRDSFERAFTTNTGGCSRRCACGKDFYDASTNRWDWEKGEFEAFEADEEAIGVDYSIGTVRFEGSEYVVDCDCWLDRADRIMGFIDGHAHLIARYLELEKERKTTEAADMPTVGGDNGA